MRKLPPLQGIIRVRIHAEAEIMARQGANAEAVAVWATSNSRIIMAPTRALPNVAVIAGVGEAGPTKGTATTIRAQATTRCRTGGPVEVAVADRVTSISIRPGNQ